MATPNVGEYFPRPAEIVASTSYIPEFDMKQQFIADNLRKKFSILKLIKYMKIF